MLPKALAVVTLQPLAVLILLPKALPVVLLLIEVLGVAKLLPKALAVVTLQP